MKNNTITTLLNYALLMGLLATLCPFTVNAQTIPGMYITGYVGIESDETTKTLMIKNNGGGTLSWSIGNIQYMDGSDWITSVSPMAGDTEDISIVTIEVSRQGLEPGDYSAFIPINSNGGNDRQLVYMNVVPVVVPVPELSVDTESLNFGADSTEKTFTVSNAGDGEMEWNIDIIYDEVQAVEWIAVDFNTGNLNANESRTITVTVDHEDLDPGEYTAAVSVASDYGTADLTVTITVPLPDNEVLPAVDRKLLLFLKNPETEQEITIWNDLPGDMIWSTGETTYSNKGKDWLNVSPTEGKIKEGYRETLTINVTSEGLKTGLYAASVPILGHDGTEVTFTVMIWVPLFGNR